MLWPPENCCYVWASALWKYGGVSLESLSSGNEGVDPPLNINGVYLAHFMRFSDMEGRADVELQIVFQEFFKLSVTDFVRTDVPLSFPGSWFGLSYEEHGWQEKKKSFMRALRCPEIPKSWLLGSCPCSYNISAFLHVSKACADTWGEVWPTQMCWTGSVSVSGCVNPALSSVPQRKKKES